MMRYFHQKTWVGFLLLLIPTSFALASQPNRDLSRLSLRRILKRVPSGGALARRSRGKSQIRTDQLPSQENVFATLSGAVELEKRPLKVLFLSADTGGGHRASAEALGKQFVIQYPGSTYELADVWTDHGVLPYRTLVKTYKRMSARPWEWRIFYHLSNTKLNEIGANVHSRLTCFDKIFRRIESHDPDVIVSVHPTMNHTPLLATKKLSRKLGKHIPFFTVVTDLGSGHCMWFEKRVNKLYVASDRLYRLARRRGGTPKDNIVMAGLPIRHGFAVEAEKIGDRNSPEGKAYQAKVKTSLGIPEEKPMVLVMGGGEGVGALSDIVNNLYAKLTNIGVDATICVVCGRNEQLKEELASRNWENVLHEVKTQKRRRGVFRLFERRGKKGNLDNVKRLYTKALHKIESDGGKSRGKVDVVGLGFVTNMPQYMTASDILVTKAGPGTIAEAAAVGLPVVLTSFLPGQEAGNVDVVLENGYGDYCENPSEIGETVGVWLSNTDLLEEMSVAARTAGNPTAADEIVKDIGTQTVAWMKSIET